MNLSDVKLVVTDMDGTLLNSEGAVSERFFKLFYELQKHQVHFVAASGRQYHSIAHKLNGIVNDITIIAENGGLARQAERELLLNTMSADDIKKLIPLIQNIPNSNTVLCGSDKAYIKTHDPKFIKLLSEYYTAYEVVDDLTQVTRGDFMKIAIYHLESSEEYLYPVVKHLESEMQIKVSGLHWLDISNKTSHKGHALELVQNLRGISVNETMAFGDYNNDLEMLQRAKFSYAMANAHPNVKNTARYTTDSNDEQGVENILELLLKSKA